MTLAPALLVLAASGVQDAPSWKRWTVPGTAVSFELPGIPTAMRNAPGQAKEASSGSRLVWQFSDAEVFVEASVFVGPAVATAQAHDLAAAAEALFRGMEAKGEKWTLVRSQSLELDGASVLLRTARVASGLDEVSVHVVLVADASRVVALVVVASDPASAAAERIVRSARRAVGE